MKAIYALAGFLAALVAIYVFLTGDQSPFKSPIRREIANTPWLSLGFAQEGAEVQLTKRDIRTTEVQLDRRPFQLLLPRRSDDDAYLLTAWINDSIFRRAPIDLRLDDTAGPGGRVNYFSVPTSIADTASGSGTLYLNDEGHHYLAGLRLGPDSDRHVVHYSSVFRDRYETPIEQISGPLYLVIFFDEDNDSVMDNGEYEFLVLNFRR